MQAKRGSVPSRTEISWKVKIRLIGRNDMSFKKLTYFSLKVRFLARSCSNSFKRSKTNWWKAVASSVSHRKLLNKTYLLCWIGSKHFSNGLISYIHLDMMISYFFFSNLSRFERVMCAIMAAMVLAFSLLFFLPHIRNWISERSLRPDEKSFQLAEYFRLQGKSIQNVKALKRCMWKT